MAEEKKNDFIVVNELPSIQTRNATTQEGSEYDLITTNEAIKEILEIARELRKGITGK